MLQALAHIVQVPEIIKHYPYNDNNIIKLYNDNNLYNDNIP